MTVDPNLIGARVCRDDDPEYRFQYIIRAVSYESDGSSRFWLLVEGIKDGKLLSLNASACMVVPRNAYNI